jgi:hypothetical protein
VFRKDALTPNLDNAGTEGMGQCQNRPELEIVCQDKPIFSACSGHDFRILGARRAYLRPVNCREAHLRKDRNPFGRQVHIDNDSHAHPITSSSSRSSSLQAACARASSRSAGSR